MKIYIIVMILFSAAFVGLRFVAGRELKSVIDERFYVGYALIILAGFFAPTVWLFYIVILAVYLGTVKNRADAAYRFILLVPLIPMVEWRLMVGGSYITPIRTVDLLSFALVLACMIKPARAGGRARSGFTVEDGLMIVVLLIQWVGYTRFGSATAFVRDGFQAFLTFTLPYLALRRSLSDPAVTRTMLVSMAASCVILSVFAVYEMRFGWAIFGSVFDHFEYGEGSNLNLSIRGSALRASASVGNPLSLACYMVLGFLAACVSRRYFRTAFLWWTVIAIIALGIYTTQSRGNTALVGIGLVVLLIARRRIGAAAGLSLVGMVGYGVLQLTASSSASYLAADTAVYYNGTIYSDYRSLLLARGLEEGAKHPMLGASLTNVYASLEDITQGQHIVDLVNIYLTVFLTSGYVGLTAFCLCLAGILFGLFRSLRRSKDEDMDAIAAFAIAAFVVFLAQLSFMSIVKLIPFQLALLPMIARSLKVSRPRLARTAPSPRAPGADAPAHGEFATARLAGAADGA